MVTMPLNCQLAAMALTMREPMALPASGKSQTKDVTSR
jgi:hypothetical protein